MPNEYPDDTKKKIYLLFYGDNTYLLLFCDSGVEYEHQAGGMGITTMKAEGVIYPMGFGRPSLSDKLSDITEDAYDNITPSMADEIDQVLWDHMNCQVLRVDRARLSESMEAWVYVTFHEDPLNYSGLTGFGHANGVILWENID